MKVVLGLALVTVLAAFGKHLPIQQPTL